eukprot:9450099-Karenia_brevis.AAC.1
MAKPQRKDHPKRLVKTPIRPPHRHFPTAIDRLCLHTGSSDRSDRVLSTTDQQSRSGAFIDALVSAQ